MSVRVGLGPGFGAGLGAGLSIEDYWRWIDLCEAGGIDSVWFSDQLLGATPEPVAMQAALAARTQRMRFGASALVMPFRDPLVLAKEFATIDYLSSGRLLPVFGVGNGPDPYWAATGTPPEGRGARADEAIALLRLLLEQDEVAFEGKHYRYYGPGVKPRPAKPIPLWIGGNAPVALRRTARLGDGWLGSMIGPAQAGAARRGIETELKATGRTIDPDHYGMTVIARIGSPDDPALVATRKRLAAAVPLREGTTADDILAVGSAADVSKILRRYVDEGMSKFVVIPVASDAADLFEQTRRLIEDVLPQIEDKV